jgi:hypothetical protein
MSRQKRPYFTLIVFITLLIFGGFLAWQSSVLNQQMEQARKLADGRTLYLPIAGNGSCPQAPCPPAGSPPPAYPARIVEPGPLEEQALFNPPASRLLLDPASAPRVLR